MCASQLLALHTTALLNTSLTAQELMPGLGYFAMDVAQLLRDYLLDSSIAVQVQDFCAGNRTAASFIANGTLVNATWPTLRVAINLVTTDPERCVAIRTMLCPHPGREPGPPPTSWPLAPGPWPLALLVHVNDIWYTHSEHFPAAPCAARPPTLCWSKTYTLGYNTHHKHAA
ncbi:hypothetical protein V8C86DRAFT_2717940 [Haematococcus lacustris]